MESLRPAWGDVVRVSGVGGRGYTKTGRMFQRKKPHTGSKKAKIKARKRKTT